MRISRGLAPAALLGALALALAGCADGTSAAGTTGATPSATTASATTIAPAPTPTPTPSDTVMPDLRGGSYRAAEQELDNVSLPAAKITVTARHKDVTLPKSHASWQVCDTTPRPGSPVTVGTAVVIELAQQAGDCAISFHGYLHQANDPAYTPKPTPTPRPATTHAPATSKPAGSSLTTCPDGKQGYACTSNGHPVVDGQFCPKADHGRTLKATNGTTVTCSYDPSITPYRWQ
ncbi:PASTA domain-containing protein [Streptomyces canus]|uniref:PASTA domain-containing protein n=1 Tax=Streptomyces canus TaxID=58343 RepID=UPI0022570074|nr:PASTA domain-containing protein [Streptomyces canus]MCX4857539.1 PASTA domain-containing protein [Streptomyces canus]WSW37116.1 PASTA domain-containing protein [Streptomyces canus]